MMIPPASMNQRHRLCVGGGSGGLVGQRGSRVSHCYVRSLFSIYRCMLVVNFDASVMMVWGMGALLAGAAPLDLHA